MKALIPNLLTAGNLVGGVLAIIFSLTGRLEWAPYCIFISAFLDFFDGFAARLLNVQSEMGKQLDSLADMVTFGVAPGVMMFMLFKAVGLYKIFAFTGTTSERVYITQNDCHLSFNRSGEDHFENLQELILSTETSNVHGISDMSYVIFHFDYLPYIALLIPVFSLFRLAKFNLDTRQSDSFIGLPTPANTLFFASFPLILISTSSANYWIITWTINNSWFLIGSTVVMSVLLVAELPLFALKFKSFGWKGNEIRYIFLTLAVILLATLWWLAIPLIIILYILLSLIQNLRHKTAAAKTSK